MGLFNIMGEMFGLLQCKLKFLFLSLWDWQDCLHSYDKASCLFDYPPFPHLYGQIRTAFPGLGQCKSVRITRGSGQDFLDRIWCLCLTLNQVESYGNKILGSLWNKTYFPSQCTHTV